MIYASNNGHLPVVQLLIQSGVDIEAKDNVSIIDVRTVRRLVCYSLTSIYITFSGEIQLLLGPVTMGIFQFVDFLFSAVLILK